MKRITILIGMLLLLTTFVSATDVDLFMPENKEVFTTNAPVIVGFYMTGVSPIECVFEQKSSNRYFEIEPDTHTFWAGWNYVWIVNDILDWHLYNGRYKLQIVCTDANGNVSESEAIKFHVKGDMKWAEDDKKDWEFCFDKYQKCMENHEFPECYEKYSKCVNKILS